MKFAIFPSFLDEVSVDLEFAKTAFPSIDAPMTKPDFFKKFLRCDPWV